MQPIEDASVRRQLLRLNSRIPDTPELGCSQQICVNAKRRVRSGPDAPRDID